MLLKSLYCVFFSGGLRKNQATTANENIKYNTIQKKNCTQQITLREWGILDAFFMMVLLLFVSGSVYSASFDE